MSNTAGRPMGPVEWSILGALALLWGFAFFFIEIALRSLPPFTLVLSRVGLAALLLTGIALLRGRALPRGASVWGAFLILALFNNAMPFALYAWGQQSIASGLASILNATTPLWGVVVAHLFTRDERASPGKVAGVLLGIAGVVIMIGHDALGGLGRNVLAQLACLGATLCYALAGVYGRRFKAMGFAPVDVATGQLIAATLLIAPVAFIVDRPWTLAAPGMDSVLAILGLVLFSTMLAYFLYFELLARAGATNSLLVTFLVPIPAILLGTLLLGEALQPRHYLGLGLIALGLAAIDGRPLARLRGVRPAAQA